MVAIPAHTPVYISPSQIDDVDVAELPKEACWRRWGFQRIDRLPKTQHPSAARGDRIHEALELLAHGIRPEPDAEHADLVRRMAEHVKPPTERTLIEHPFKTPIGPAILSGVIDRLDVPVSGPVEITDWKSTGNLKWAKTEKRLRKAVQANTYAHWAMTRIQRDAAIVRFIYGETKTGIVKPVQVTLSLTETREFVSSKLPIVERMVSLRRQEGLRAMDLEPNFKACNAFGGCPYRLQCGLRPEQWVTGAMQMSGPDLLSQLRGEAAQAAPNGGGALPAGFQGFPGTQPQAPAPAPAPFLTAQPPAGAWSQPAPVAAAPAPQVDTSAAVIAGALLQILGQQAFNQANVGQVAQLAKAYAQALK